MISIENRKTKLRFETSIAVRGRAICVEVTPYTVIVREKGRRQKYEVQWDSVYWLAVKVLVDARRREKKARKSHG